jgi:hypothetical protein
MVFPDAEAMVARMAEFGLTAARVCARSRRTSG